jgi:hypothetical protein
MNIYDFHCCVNMYLQDNKIQTGNQLRVFIIIIIIINIGEKY